MKFCLHTRRDVFLAVLLSGAMLATPFGSLHGQALSSDQANDAALQLMNDGRLPEAAAAFEDILKKYPTSTIVPDVQYRLANLYYIIGNYAKSKSYIDKITRPPAPDDIVELGFGLLPQMLAAKAEKETDPKSRLAAYERAIKEYDAFLQKYPGSSQVENIVYSRALAYYQIAKYEQASETLRANLKQFPTSETILESQMLLAISEMTRGCMLAQESLGQANPQADEAFNESERLLTGIISRRTDIALINDAQLHLGELNANRALLAPEAAKGALYEKSLQAYRSLMPKEAILAAQKAQIKQLQDRRLAALAAKNIAAMKALDVMVNHAVEKLAALNGKGDLSLAALIKTGQLFLQKGAYDEARLIFREMQPFAQTDEQKKTLLFNLTVSYAQQAPKIPVATAALTEKAVENYKIFQGKYKGDPLADSLPYMIGNLHLGTDPQKALKYYDEQISLYPKSSVATETILRQATAYGALKQFGKAKATFESFLKQNPKREIAADAQFGLADLLRESGNIDGALAEYTKIAANYKGLPQAEYSAFWIAMIHLQKGACDAAITEFTDFLKNFPNNAQCPMAKYHLGKAYVQKADTASAARVFKEIIDESPKSQPAVFAYFERISLMQGADQATERASLMREFIQRYPNSDKIYYAYNTLAQDLVAAKKIPEALALYQEMVEKHPADPQSALALFNIAALWFQQTNALGRYYALNDAQRAEWVETVNNSLAATEKLITNYPEHEQLAQALQYALLNQKRLVDAKLKTADEITGYFQDLASKFTSKPQTRGKILFALASFTYETDKAKALEQMKAAYDPKTVLAPANIDLYGGALLDNGELEKAASVFQKLAGDFPNPDPACPEKSPLQVQQAQAIVLHGQAKILQKKGAIGPAAEKFEAYKKLYPNFSPLKVLEANYGIALAACQNKQHDKADPLLTQIIRTPSAGIELRANAMLLHAKIREEKNELAPAIDENLKIAVVFEAVPAAAAEGLWRGAQLLEKQASALPPSSQDTKAPTKPGQLQKALKAYKDLVTKYPQSPHTFEAKARISILETK